jgi:asparagine synthetase B (glutamine-hydrolysing)
VAASNVTALLDAGGPRRLDQAQLRHYASHGFVHPLASAFEGIRAVAPGEVVMGDLATGEIASSRVERASTSYEGFDWASDAAVDAELARLLRRAVEKRVAGLRSPVLVFSGGVDSTVLAAEMAAVAPGLVLVGMRQPLPWMNDAPYAREAARFLGQPLRYVNPWRRLFPNVREALRRTDQPFAVAGYVFLSLLTMRAREHGNVLFTGDGGDEVFFGYRRPSAWMAPPAAASEPVPVGPPFAFPLTEYGVQQGTIDLVGHGFVKVDKATAENQMEGRCPLLDWDLMAFVRQAPPSYWLRHDDETKYPLKKLLLDRGFSSSFVHRKKLGFALPFRYLLTPMLPEIRRKVRANKELLREYGLWDAEIASSDLAALRRFDATWKAYVLAEWADRVGIG